jgi:hypothetical protein
MSTRAWVGGILGLVCLAQGAMAADYTGHRVWHRHWRHHGFGADVGTCVRTRVAGFGTTPGETAPAVIRYTDGVLQAYDSDMLGHQETRPGDPIQLCLVSFTRDCGDADLPGRTYATGNLRTGAAWTLPDVRSSCRAR